MAVMAACLAGVIAGCKGNVSSKPTDASVDKMVSGDGSGTQTCKDDGTTNKGNGETCACATQCKSGFCADGFCCNTACDGTCMSCGLATNLGTCTPTPAGVAPRVATQCKAEDVATCGLDGMCDGKGKCRNFPALMVCHPGSCDTDSVSGTYRCDGLGSCKMAASVVCAPYSCDGTTNKCFASCTTDANCVAGRKCVNSMCGLKLNGAACVAGPGECASGHCADGVCCNTACGGACRSCNQTGLEGMCSPTPAGKGHPLCLKQDPSTCGSTGVCDGFSTCSIYPANSPCGASSCSGTSAMNTARSCDGLGSCQASEVRQCGNYRCENGACDTTCSTVAMCAAGIACTNGSCGTHVDGEPCTADADCQNQHCVRDIATGDGVCCNTACTGACRSCALSGTSHGKCTLVASGANDPRGTCADLTPAMCSTDGKCDGAGACRKYPAGTTVCAPETCVSDIYTGPSTCNASGQCIKPSATPCLIYHCNGTKCFTACTTDAMCVPPNICGMGGVISSCGLAPNGAPCSMGSQCLSNFCAQGICCNSACTGACQACDRAGTAGTCTNVPSGPDPNGVCAVQAASTCGTTGQCAAGQCARFAAGTQCVAASCTNASTVTVASTCNGTGTCSAPAMMTCAPGRCVAAAGTATCNNTCTVATQATDCTPPATCVNGSCGLQGAGGPCTVTTQCATGLACATRDGVCCNANNACLGVCETCKPPGLPAGTCTAVGAGVVDPSGMCVMAASTTCGFNGRCKGNNTGLVGTMRCQDYDSTNGCRTQMCVDNAAGVPSTLTLPANCNGTGMCSTLVTQTCGTNKCLDATQCGSSCNVDGDCISPTLCNTFTHHCGTKQQAGEACLGGAASTDCDTALSCVDGVCCHTACTGPCVTCNGATPGTCTALADGTMDAMCLPVVMPCGHTGLCKTGACANIVAGTNCGAASCPTSTTFVLATMCDGSGACSPAGMGTCANNLVCSGTACLSACLTDGDCTGGKKCNTVTGQCTGRPLGGICAAGTDCGSGNCVDLRCCSTGSCSACNSCDKDGSGTCKPDPDGMSLADCPAGAACGNTGMCAGGACALAAINTPCGTTCMNNADSTMQSAFAAKQCDGGGNCVPGTPGPCPNNFKCADATSCATVCTTGTECVTPFTCTPPLDAMCI